MTAIDYTLLYRDAEDETRSLIEIARLRQRLPNPRTRRLIRIAAGVSQVELAAAIGVTASALSRWETGDRSPRGAARDRYIDALGKLQEVGQ